jgi:hypothetical protein
MQAPAEAHVKQCCFIHQTMKTKCNDSTLVFDIDPVTNKPDLSRAQYFCPLHNAQARQMYNDYKQANKLYNNSKLYRIVSNTMAKAIQSTDFTQAFSSLQDATSGRRLYADSCCPGGMDHGHAQYLNGLVNHTQLVQAALANASLATPSIETFDKWTTATAKATYQAIKQDQPILFKVKDAQTEALFNAKLLSIKTRLQIKQARQMKKFLSKALPQSEEEWCSSQTDSWVSDAL